MVEDMHNETVDQMAEEETLDRAMMSIDPMLQASLQKEQQRRRQRFLLWGVAMLISCVCAVAFLWPASDSSGASVKTGAENAAANEHAVAGWKLWQAGKPQLAEERFRKAVELEPNSADLRNGLGWSLLGQMKFDQSAAEFEKALKTEPDHPAALNGLGQVQFNEGKLGAAEATLRKAFDRAPAARFTLARILLVQKKFDEASRVLEKTLAGDTTGHDTKFLQSLKAAADAKKLPKKLALQLAPPKAASGGEKEAMQANIRGWQMFNAGRASDAEKAFREAITHKPDFPAALNGLGFALLNQGKAKEALPIFEQLYKSDPNNGGFANGLARAYEQTGDLDKAIEIWKKSDDGKQVTALTWGLARTLTSQGKLKDALPYWQRIQKSNPDDATVKQMIEKCQRG